MHFDEYQRLSAACRTMAAQLSNHGLDKARWSRLAEHCSDLADEVVAMRVIYVGNPRKGSVRALRVDGQTAPHFVGTSRHPPAQ